MKKVFLLMAFSAIVVSRVAAASGMGCDSVTCVKNFTSVEVTAYLFINPPWQGLGYEDVDSTIKVELNLEGTFRADYTTQGIAHIIPGTTTGRRILTFSLDSLYPGMAPAFNYWLFTNAHGDTTAGGGNFGTLPASPLNTVDTASITGATLFFSGSFNGIDTSGYYQWVVASTNHTPVYTGSINSYIKGTTSASGSIPFSLGAYPDNQYEVTLKVWNPLFPTGVSYTRQVFRVPPPMLVAPPLESLRIAGDSPTGVENIFLDTLPEEKYFSLSGQQLDAAPDGVYIRCIGSKCRVIKKE